MESISIISVFFFLIGISVIIKNINSKEYLNFFWFCDFVPFLFAIGFLFNNLQLVKAIINIGLFGQIITFTGVVPTRFKEWKKGKLFQGKFYAGTEFLIHLTAFFALILTYNIQPKIQSLVYSLMILIFMFLITLIFTPCEKNINVIYYSEFDFGKIKKRFKLPYHTFLWIFYGFLVTLLTFFIQYFIYSFFRI